MSKTLKCAHCNYRWKPKQKKRPSLPKSCPNCKQYGKVEWVEEKEVV